jgi:hypothetical protein
VVLKGGSEYLDVCFKHLHLANTAEEGECMTIEKFAQGSEVREGVSEGCFAYVGDVKF